MMILTIAYMAMAGNVTNKTNLLIAIGADHAGFEMKEHLKQFFQQEGCPSQI